MRKIVVGMVIVLTASGLLVGFGGPLGLGVGPVKWLSIGHIWIGIFFLVLFPLYAWDHIKANRAWLRKWSGVTLTGTVQTLSAVLLILTGVVLYVYGVQTWPQVRQWHHWLTYPLVVAVATHYLLPKGTPRKTSHPPAPQNAGSLDNQGP